jgi:phosphoribosylanthranilate isomerase
VHVDVKMCGLMQPADARAAADLGAAYVGVIFASGPRTLDPSRARVVLDGAGGRAARVGVFGPTDPAALAAIVREAGLDIVQLHADPTAADVRAARDASGAKVWAVVRVDGPLSSAALHSLWESADAVVLDAKAKGVLGGTGTSFDWSAAAAVAREHEAPLVVAGGLTAENVARAIEALAPDVVDVSSGVESAPGVKDRARMAGFIDAVRRAGETQ